MTSGNKLTVGSLFAGIGGFDLGLERAGFEIKWQVEIDPFCRAVLEKHWPQVKRYEDVREVHKHGRGYWYTCEESGSCGDCLEPVDLLCGGFPCQDVSQAGKRTGIDGERSGLWSEFYRLIRELRPRYVLVENVPGLLVRGFERVLGDLAACGYDAEWDCIPASAIGAPHRRDRVWVVAYANSRRRESWAECQEERRLSIALTGGEVRAASAVPDATDAGDVWRSRLASDDRIAFRPDVRGADFDDLGSWWIAEPDLGRVAHGVPNRVDRLKGLGNAIVPQIAEWIGRRILEAEADLAVCSSLFHEGDQS